MKTEITSPVVVNSESKMDWTSPTLTSLSLTLNTLAMTATGGDGMATGGSLS